MRIFFNTLLFSALALAGPALAEEQALAEQRNVVLGQLLNEVAPDLAEQIAPTDKDTTKQPKSKRKKAGKKKTTSTARAGESSTSKVPNAKPSPLVAQQKLQKVKASMAQGVPASETRRELTELLGTYPDFAEARLLLGREQIASEDFDAALSNLAHLLNPSNPDWQPWFWVATAYLAKGDLESAKQHLERAASKNSRVCALWIQLSVLYQELGEHSSALQYLHIAEQIDANHGLLHFNRAYSLEQLGRPAQARRAYQRFLISDIEPSASDLRVLALQRIDTLSQGVEVANRGHR